MPDRYAAVLRRCRVPGAVLTLSQYRGWQAPIRLQQRSRFVYDGNKALRRKGASSFIDRVGGLRVFHREKAVFQWLPRRVRESWITDPAQG